MQVAEVTFDNIFPKAKFLINSWSELSIWLEIIAIRNMSEKIFPNENFLRIYETEDPGGSEKRKNIPI